MKTSHSAAPLVVFALALPCGAASQEIPRDEYLNQLPLSQPRLVQQTAASLELQLFGDPAAPGYRDQAPRDGIDDARNEILLSLAVRFAPFMVQNTEDIPVNFQHFIDNRDSFPLWLDTWDISGVSPELAHTRGVNFSVLGQEPCDPDLLGRAFELDPLPTTDASVEDCKVLELLDRFAPGAGATIDRDQTLMVGQPNELPVLFFNTPGEGEGSWDGVYQDEYDRTPPARRNAFPHAFVHPFVEEVSDEEGRGRPGYELVLQYWFYYPTNDSGMNHEGDWEHLNVVVSPVSRVEGALSAETVRRILDGSIPVDGEADPLVIKRLDYYLHHLVMPLDFSSPNVYRPRSEWEEVVARHPQERFREQVLWRQIREMAYVDEAETTLNTHPLVYIGADNKGLNQAMELPGASNQDSHASYPFSGRYPNVGPGGTTDEVGYEVDFREHLRATLEGVAGPGPEFEGGSVLSLVDPERLRILPDWERLVDLVREDAGARRDWAWMVLPIRWGYPATVSPFSGLLENVNLGNVAPVGPSYSGGWNATGASPGFSYYEPHAMPDLLPLQLQDNFRNDLGFLNLTVPTLFNLPPLDFVSRLVAYPVRKLLGRPGTVYYPTESLPFRFVGVSSGLSVQLLSSDFDALAVNAQQFESFISETVLFFAGSGGDSTTTSLGSNRGVRTAVGTFVSIPFYLGQKFVSENTVRNVRSGLEVEVPFNNIPTYTYDADINMWEYVGGLRYSPFIGNVRPYVRGGYGWSWYRLQDARVGGQSLDPSGTDWIGPSSILPNLWHYGLGLEVILLRGTRAGISGVDLGLRLEYGRYLQSLDLDLSSIPLNELALAFPTLADIPSENVGRHDFVLALTVSF